MDDALVDVAAGKIRRLLVEMPPRHGKSETCSRFFPAWYLGTHPKARVILTSYGTDFARTWGLKAKRVLDEFGPRFGVSVRSDSKAAADWETDKGGGMVTAGIGTGITGRGANVLIIDDPVKDQEEAASATIQERNWDWYQSTARTRLEPNGAVVLIQTRWHEKDLAGRILEEEGHEWTRIRLPAVAESHDLLGRTVGEALWPARFSISDLEDIRAGKIDVDTGHRRGGLSAYWWSALYQQSPTPDTGNIFDRRWWRRYHATRLPAATNGAIFVDVAHGEKTQGDFCDIAVWKTAGFDFYNTYRVHERLQFPELLQAILDLRSGNGAGLPIVVEDTPGSKPLIQSLQRLVSGVLPWSHKGLDKVAWANSVAPYVEAGNCYLPIDASWAGDFINEHAAFPNGSYDDMVTTTYMALSWLSQRQALQPYKPQGTAVEYRNGHTQYADPVKAGRA